MLIRTKYPDIADKIGAELGKSFVQQRDAKNALIEELRQRARELRNDLSERSCRIAKLGNENARLVLENERLRALAAGEPKAAIPDLRGLRLNSTDVREMP